MVTAEVLVIGKDLVDVPGEVVGSGGATRRILGELVGVHHLGGVIRVHIHAHVVEDILVAGIALTLEGDLVAQALDEREVHLGVSDTVQVHALALVIRIGIGVILTVADERAVVPAVRLGIIPVTEAVLTGIDIGKRGVPHGVADAGGSAPAVGGQEVGLHTHGEPVGHVEIEFRHGAQLLVVVTLADALLTGVVAGNVVARTLGAAADGNVILLAHALAGDLVQPVYPKAIIPCTDLIVRQKAIIGGLLETCVIGPVLVFVVYITGSLEGLEAVAQEGLLVGNHLRHAGPVGQAHAGVHAHDRGLGGTLLGGDDDHTVCSTGTVDGGGGSILQHVNGLDVGGVDRVDRTVGQHTIDNEQRLVHALCAGAHATTGRDSVLTTDRHRSGVVTGRSRSRSVIQTGHLAGQGGEGVRVRQRSHVGVVAIVYAGDGTGNVALAGGTITNDNYVVKEQVVLGKLDVNRLLAGDSDFLSGVADAGEDQGGIVRHIECVDTIQIGHRAGRRTLDEHIDTDERFARSVRNLTGDGILGECLHTHDQERRQNHHESFGHKNWF